MGLVLDGQVQQRSKAIVGPVCHRPVRLWDKNNQKVERVIAGTSLGTGMTIVISGPMSGDDNWTDAWRKCKPGDGWRTSHWETSSFKPQVQ